LIPAEYDVFIDWSPLSFKSGTDQVKLDAGKAKFQFLTKWVASTDNYKNDPTVEIVQRLAPLVVINPETEEEEVV